MKSIWKFMPGMRLSRLLALLLAICLTMGAACAEELAQGFEDGQTPTDEAEAWTQFSASASINTDAELRVGYVAAAGAQINPFLCSERDLVSLNSLVFESLVELDDNYQPTPLLADSWTNEEGTWTFKLREGVVFHNGASLTAADVLLSYQSFLAAGETNPYYRRLKLIEDMQATDEYTVTVTTDKDASGYLVLYAMTFPVVQYGTLSESMARGTGPYWYTQFVSGVGVRLEANPLWWKKDTQIQSIAAICYAESGDALEALGTNQIDILCTQSSTAAFSRRMSAYTSMDYLTTTYEMIVPNLSESSLMSDVRMRQAVMYAIDRAAIAENAYLGMGIQCEVPVNPGSWLYESQSAIYYYSPERALQLLQSCGWSDLTGDGLLNQVDGVRLKDLELRMVVYNESTNSIRENAANMIAEYLEQVGVKVNIEVRGRERVLRYINEGNYDIALVGVNLSEVPNLSQMFGNRGDINLNSYANEELRSLIKLVPNAASADELKSLYSQIQMHIVEKLPVMGLLFRTGTVLSRRSLAGLSGISVSNTLNGIEFMQSELR